MTEWYEGIFLVMFGIALIIIAILFCQNRSLANISKTQDMTIDLLKAYESTSRNLIHHLLSKEQIYSHLKNKALKIKMAIAELNTHCEEPINDDKLLAWRERQAKTAEKLKGQFMSIAISVRECVDICKDFPFDYRVYLEKEDKKKDREEIEEKNPVKA